MSFFKRGGSRREGGQAEQPPLPVEKLGSGVESTTNKPTNGQGEGDTKPEIVFTDGKDHKVRPRDEEVTGGTEVTSESSGGRGISEAHSSAAFHILPSIPNSAGRIDSDREPTTLGAPIEVVTPAEPVVVVDETIPPTPDTHTSAIIDTAPGTESPTNIANEGETEIENRARITEIIQQLERGGVDGPSPAQVILLNSELDDLRGMGGISVASVNQTPTPPPLPERTITPSIELDDDVVIARIENSIDVAQIPSDTVTGASLSDQKGQEKPEPTVTELSPEQKAEKRKEIGNKILGSIAQIEVLRKLQPGIEKAIARAEKTNNPALGQTSPLTIHQKRLARNITDIGRHESRVTSYKETFGKLGGTSEEIERLIAENSSEKPPEKPLAVPEPDTVTLAEEMIADQAILGSMAAGLDPEVVADAQEVGSIEGGETPEAIAVTPPLVTEQIQTVENLEEAINIARSLYVKEDVRTMTTRNRLAVHFPWLKDEGSIGENKDLTSLRESYRGLLKQHQEQELKKIREAKSTEERGETLEAILKYFRFDEAVRLDQEYIAIQKENQGLGGKVLGAYETMGRWYNSLSKAQKIIIGGGAFVGAMALSAAGGIGVAVGAPGVVFARRLLAGAGAAVTLDAISEKWLEGRKAKEEKTQITEKIDSTKDLSNEDLAAQMGAFLDESILSLDKEVEKRRKKTTLRKWTSRVVGAGSGIVISNLFQGLFSDTPDVSGEGTTSHEVSAAQVTEKEVTTPASEAPKVTGEGGLPAETGGATPIEQVTATAAVPETYTVTANDGSRGLWGILEKSLPADLSEADKNKALVSIENLIANKLENLSAEEQAALGFRGGDINTIYAGETLKLGSLVSQDEWKEILAGKTIEPQGVAESAKTVFSEAKVNSDFVAQMESTLKEVSAEAKPDDIIVTDINEVIDAGFMEGTLEAPVKSDDIIVTDINKVIDAGFMEGTLGVPVETPVEPDTALLEEVPVDQTAELIQSGAVEKTVFAEQLGGLRQAIFVTRETSNWPLYSFTLHPEMGAVPMGEVLADNASQSNLPLHESQIARLQLAAAEAGKTYGKVGYPVKSETITQYTRRLTALGFVQKNPLNKINFT